jgi:hypothetical protein
MSGSSDAGKESYLLTFGEAADLASLALLDLRRAVQNGRIETLTGWQFGHPVDLIRLENLVREYPEAAERTVIGPSLQSRGIRLDPSAEGFTPQPRQVTAPSAKADDLRAAFKRARVRNEELVQELSASGAQMRGLLERIEVHEDPSAGSSAGASSASQEQQAKSERRAFGTGMAPLSSIQPASELEVLKGRVRRLRTVALVTGGLALVLAVLGPILWDGRTVHAGPPAEDSITVAMHQAGPALSTKGGDQEDLQVDTPERGTGPGDGEAGIAMLVTPELNDQPLVSGPEDLLPAALLSEIDACTWFAKTQRGSDLRQVLGPCEGPWNPEQGVVSGIHVHQGERYCRHHLFFGRRLGGALAEQRDIARFQAREGHLAPLMTMRLDRAAKQVVRGRTGGWLTSGFEALDGHKWTRGEKDGVWVLDSWAHLVDAGKRRHFRLQMQIADGATGDFAQSFDWLD